MLFLSKVAKMMATLRMSFDLVMCFNVILQPTLGARGGAVG
jgi:uncharacterized protein involved in copper resistance